MDATTLLSSTKLIAVVTIENGDQAVPLAQALLAGGINTIEVTLRTKTALTAMEYITAQVPQILLGAGSVRYTEQFAEIQQAGCAFAVSPGATDRLLDYANLPYIPGAATASECLKLLERGYTLQKFFPAESNGGVGALKSIAAPLPEVRFCPTGGVTAALVREYLALDAVSCVGGSWFVPAKLLENGDFSAIEQCARDAVQLTHG
ncbi:UNVERIFIED_CONTAM: hypothetical protein GTU68_028571 [Idotea baltica]|nr:hypothetical protein [Idotea baltica]